MSRKIAILTGGGDCPGLNVAIRTVTRVAVHEHDCDVVGILDGFGGLIQRRFRPLGLADVRGILRLGGTILGASNRANPFAWRETPDADPVDVSRLVCETIEFLGIEALIVVGGDGTLAIASQFAERGVPIVAIPKTIDNDVHGTDTAIGFDTCVATVTDALDRLHSTAESHHRVMLVEVMGRTAGWVALYSGVAGGADMILIPERSYSLESLVETVERRHRSGRRFTIGVVAEGAKSPGGENVYQSRDGESYHWKLGGVCQEIADALESVTSQEVRTIVLGHLQRGGAPTAFDRSLATCLAHAAVEAAMRGESGVMIGASGSAVRAVPLREASTGPRLVPDDHCLLKAANDMGMYVG